MFAVLQRLLAVCFPFYGGLIVVCFLITFLPKLYFSILIPHRKGWASIAEKGRKKAADYFFLVTDFDLI